MAQGEGYGRELHGGGAERMMFAISNLRDCLQFQHSVANRIWEAWWRPNGHGAKEIFDGVSTIAAATGFPFALVAHADNVYHGHVLGIASDLTSRPDLTPWAAALWVDPAYRRKGIATALLRSAEEEFSRLGFSRVYLCATE